jgi:uncharacterized protein Veg
MSIYVMKIDHVQICICRYAYNYSDVLIECVFAAHL